LGVNWRRIVDNYADEYDSLDTISIFTKEEFRKVIKNITLPQTTKQRNNIRKIIKDEVNQIGLDFDFSDEKRKGIYSNILNDYPIFKIEKEKMSKGAPKKQKVITEQYAQFRRPELAQQSQKPPRPASFKAPPSFEELVEQLRGDFGIAQGRKRLTKKQILNHLKSPSLKYNSKQLKVDIMKILKS